MVLDAVSNFVRGRVSAAVDTSDTTVSVEDASIFPDPEEEGEYNLVIWDANNFPRPDQDSDVEIVRVTGRDTDADELTVERGQETTSDVAHPEGSAVHLSPTAKMFSDIEAEYTAQGENFDGQGTSEFENLQSVNTEQANITTVDDSVDTAATNVSYATDVAGKILHRHTDRISDGESVTFSEEIGDYDKYIIEFTTAVTSDGTSLSLRYNGIDTADYDYSTISDTITRNSDETEILLFESLANVDIGGEYQITGTGSNRSPSVFGGCGVGSPIRPTLHKAGANSSNLRVALDSIELIASGGDVAFDAESEYNLIIKGVGESGN